MHMDKMEFVAALVMEYKGKDPDKKDAYQKSVGYFADNCPEINLAEVYSYAMTQKFKSAAMLYTYAKEQGFISNAERVQKQAKYYYKCNGFYKKIVTGKNDKGADIWERKHFSCDTFYSGKSGACPNCGSTSATVIMDNAEEGFPDKVKMVQPQCFLCSRYTLEIKDRKPYILGPECGTFGDYNMPDSSEYCKACKCRDCCIDAKNEKFNRASYYFRKDGEHQDIKQDWLHTSRSPGEHIFDFNRVSLNKKTIVKGL